MRLIACVALLAIAGCNAPPMGLYCEGGVRDGHEDGGECFRISSDKIDTDPTSVGSARREGAYANDAERALRYSVRRVSRHAFRLYLNGELAGTLDHDASWIHVKLASQSRAFAMRSDLPGVFN